MSGETNLNKLLSSMSPKLLVDEYVFCSVKNGISANVVAAYYHDHIFVQSVKAELALDALNDLNS